MFINSVFLEKLQELNPSTKILRYLNGNLVFIDENKRFISHNVKVPLFWLENIISTWFTIPRQSLNVNYNYANHNIYH